MWANTHFRTGRKHSSGDVTGFYSSLGTESSQVPAQEADGHDLGEDGFARIAEVWVCMDTTGFKEQRVL